LASSDIFWKRARRSSIDVSKRISMPMMVPDKKKRNEPAEVIRVDMEPKTWSPILPA